MSADAGEAREGAPELGGACVPVDPEACVDSVAAAGVIWPSTLANDGMAFTGLVLGLAGSVGLGSSGTTGELPSAWA
jgi:hypothetical protein